MAYTVPKLKSFTPAALDKAVEKLLAALKEEAAGVTSEADRKAFRDRWIGRKNGVLTEINDLWLKAAPKDAKRDVGQRVNEVRKRVTAQVEAAPHAGHEVSGHVMGEAEVSRQSSKQMQS